MSHVYDVNTHRLRLVRWCVSEQMMTRPGIIPAFGQSTIFLISNQDSAIQVDQSRKWTRPPFRLHPNLHPDRDMPGFLSTMLRWKCRIAGNGQAPAESPDQSHHSFQQLSNNAEKTFVITRRICMWLWFFLTASRFFHRFRNDGGEGRNQSGLCLYRRFPLPASLQLLISTNLCRHIAETQR